jgi:uncharacterized protein YecE (DUF72 family)
MNDRLDLDGFHFRGLHPLVSLGTASDRYSGWIGQIYTENRYLGRISGRNHKVGGKSFKEQVLPVDSLSEYFEHFRVLEVDYTFYGPLLDETGCPTGTHAVLRAYAEHLEPDDRLILKVPQQVCAQKVRQGGGYVPNPTYLDAVLFRRRFYEPALALLGDRLQAFVFEQEYQRGADRVPPRELASRLDAFFRSVEPDARYHFELRTEAYLTREVFDMLERHGVGQVLSHWTWLPPLRRQAGLSGWRTLNGGNRRVVRLMTPRNVRYEDAYAMAHPFGRLVEGMLQQEMVRDVVELMRRDTRAGVELSIIINNRSGGNAPLIAREIVRSFLDAEAGPKPRG